MMGEILCDGEKEVDEDATSDVIYVEGIPGRPAQDCTRDIGRGSTLIPQATTAPTCNE